MIVCDYACCVRRLWLIIRIAPLTWPSVCTSAYPIACFTFGISCSLQAAEMAAAKRQPPETKNKVGRPRLHRPSDDDLAEAVAVIEAEASGANPDGTPSIFDEAAPSQPPAVVPDTPGIQRLDTQVIAHSVPPSHVSCIRTSMECV